MINVRFTNFIRSVVVPMTEEAVSAIFHGAELFSVLSREQVADIENGMTNPYNGIRPGWNEIVARADGRFIWAGDPVCVSAKRFRHGENNVA